MFTPTPIPPSRQSPHLTNQNPAPLHKHNSTPSTYYIYIYKNTKMQVNVQETAVVYPSAAPFAGIHQLSHLDTDRNLHVTFRYLRVYVNSPETPNKPVSGPFEVISTALSAALVPYYHFTGSLRRRDSDGRLELHCEPGRGVPVIVAEADFPLTSVDYLDNDPDEELVEKLVPDPNPDEVMAHPMTLQLTVFSCGGFALGTALHHALCDGLGATLFFNVMAGLARGTVRTEVEPVWDRVKLLGPRDPPRVEFPVHEFLSFDREFPPYSEKTGPVVRIFSPVKDAWLDRLKEILHDQSGGSKFTTFEALGAFIWRARVKASEIPSKETVKFAYSINVRKIVNPPLPAGYWGNGCVPMYAVSTAGEILSQPIWKTAKLIKKSKYNVSDEYVRSFIDFQELNYDKGITAGAKISGFTDWRHLGHSTVDFGWGGPVTVIPLSRTLLGSVEPCFFLPYSSANVGPKDGFKLSVYLQQHAVPAFRQEMDKLSALDNECL